MVGRLALAYVSRNIAPLVIIKYNKINITISAQLNKPNIHTKLSQLEVLNANIKSTNITLLNEMCVFLNV